VLNIALSQSPRVKITPSTAVKHNTWDASAGLLSLQLSHTEGAVEIEIEIAP
jgi:hypothetical protein